MIQKQWLNLYLFDIYNFSFYKLLYFLSGLLCPFLTCINSINKFTYYKFKKNNINTNNFIKGKSLLLVAGVTLIILSSFIYIYISLNLDLIFKLFINSDVYYIDNNKIILFIFTFSLILLFKKTKIFLKRLILLNFLITSISIWYIEVNNIILDDKLFIYNYLNNVDLNLNYINIIFLLTIECLYYFWTFVSYSNNLSEWKVPSLSITEIVPIFKIIIFYFLVIVYYSILV